MIQGVNAASEGELVSTNNTSEDSEETASQPPSNRISKEVNLLTGLVLSPEAHTTQQEGPLIGVTSIRMTASQLAIMIKHGPLKLPPLAQEGHRLDLAFRLLASSVVFWQRGNILGHPDVGAGGDLLVAIDFLLLVAPVRQGFTMRPHGDLAGLVNEFEVGRDSPENRLLLAMLNANLE